MKSKLVAIIAAVGVVLTAAVVLAVKYDDWFVTPKVIQAKRGYAMQQMRDPDTVQFRGERLTQGGWLCGELNGKNGYGAYTGFKRFMSFGYDDAWIEGSGYVGKEKPILERSNQVSEKLDAEIAVLSAHKQLLDQGIAKERLTKEQIRDQADQYLFTQRWQKHCS